MRRIRSRFCKAEARRLLGQQNLFTLILASLVLVMMTLAWQMIVGGFFAFFDFGLYAPEPPDARVIEIARNVVTALGWFVLLMPLWYGLRGIAMTMVAEQGTAEPGQLFAAFADPGTLMRVWRASAWIVWRFALSAGLVWALWYGVGALEPFFPPVLFFFLCAGAGLLTPFLLTPLVGTRLIYPLLLADPAMGVWVAVRMSTRLAFRSLAETLLFWGSFLGWFALAFVSGGVLLVLYVLPYFILADTVYVHCRIAGLPTTISTKEINHVQ